MDRKSLEAIARVQDMKTSGDVYSPEVKARIGQLTELNMDELMQLYRDSFDRARELAERLIASSDYDAAGGILDMNRAGLGQIALAIHAMEEDHVSTIIKLDPDYRTQEVISEDDTLILLNDDGTLDPGDNVVKFAARALDFIETLEILSQT